MSFCEVVAPSVWCPSLFVDQVPPIKDKMAHVSRIDVFQSDRGLMSCLKSSDIKEDWSKEFLSFHKLETLDDFIFSVTSSDWEDGIEAMCKQVRVLAVAIARFRSACEAGQAIKLAAQVASKTTPDALDEMLPQSTSEQLTKDFVAYMP